MDERLREATALEESWGEDFDLSTVAPNADPKLEMRSLAYSMPLVRVLAAPLSWTTELPRVGLCCRWRLTAARVVPQATPMTMSESNHEARSFAEVTATWSSRLIM